MRRLPVVPTLVVLLACAAMIALGIWQLGRRSEKEALIALYGRNQALSSEIAFPELSPVPDDTLFRHSSVVCLEPVRWERTGGRSAQGTNGFRALAHCRTGVEGPGLIIDMGVGKDPNTKPAWRGGEVHGIIALAPDSASLIEKLLGKAAPPRAMLVSSLPASGLEPSETPSPQNVPNNHFAYAIQWFLFAAIAALIYGLALWRRMKAE